MSVQDVDRALRGCGLSDRIGALLTNLTEHHVDAIMTLQRLIAATSLIGRNLKDDTDRRRLAMAMHEAATDIESEYEPLVKVKD